VAAPVQRPPARRPVPVAADTQGGGGVRGGHSTVRTPTTVRTPIAVPEAAADSHGVRGRWCRNYLDTGRGVRLPGRLRQDGGGPAAAVPARRQRRTLRCSSGLVNWARSTPPADTGCPDARPPAAACRTPGARTPPARRRPATTAGACGHCGSGHAGQPAADPSATVAMSDRNRTPLCGTGQHPPDRQIRSLVLCVELVGPRRICPAHVGCVVGRVGSRRVPSDRLDDQAR
jgi:hypothetical protein